MRIILGPIQATDVEYKIGTNLEIEVQLNTDYRNN